MVRRTRQALDKTATNFCSRLLNSEPLQIRDHGMDRPTQLIWGYNDPTAPISMGRALYDLIAARERRAHFNIFNEAGHFTYREHPIEFNACLHAFIEGVGA